ncbi:MAG: hypothetical protein SFV51_10380 [Bryobacteraceae bacterium]|nr:hypothetical protein [Bryobacteraceae bacterium]
MAAREWEVLRGLASMETNLLRQGDREDSGRAVRALLNLLALADQASENAGIPFNEPAKEQDFYFHARRRLMSLGLGSSLCERIPHARGRVLPKMHTGQSGLTLRSLSHHLAFCPPSEIIPKWRPFDTPARDQHFLNLLLVPWPPTISRNSFTENSVPGSSPRNMPDDFGYFNYEPEAAGGAAAHIAKCLEACPSSRFPHGVVLPELALDPREYESVREAVLAKGAFLLCGVAEKSASAESPAINRLHFDVALTDAEPDLIRFISLTQTKHHRWMLDGAQIDQYGLRDYLQRDRLWWEYCDFRDREQNIACIRNWLAIAPLICEDLARPDPIQEIVRSIGPNLVVALLMDGPQLQTRWSRRYASVLSDDPGCSVLTLTSVGMIKLTEEKYPRKKRAHRIIALWQDRLNPPREIGLSDDSDAVLLRIAKTARREWTADGRSDGNGSFYAIIEDYAHDVLQIRTGATRKSRATSTGGT